MSDYFLKPRMISATMPVWVNSICGVWGVEASRQFDARIGFDSGGQRIFLLLVRPAFGCSVSFSARQRGAEHGLSKPGGSIVRSSYQTIKGL